MALTTDWSSQLGSEKKEQNFCFHKIGPIMMPKSIGYKILTIFLICMCDRQDDQNRYSRSHEMCFLNTVKNTSRAIYITQTSIAKR